VEMLVDQIRDASPSCFSRLTMAGARAGAFAAVQSSGAARHRPRA
jgi:hypothetical protein